MNTVRTVDRRTFLAATAGLAAAARVGLPAQAREATAEAVADVVAANRILAREGVLDAMGHVSLRHPARPDRYLLARSVAPGSVSAADILEFDLDSRAVAPGGPASYRERFIHGAVYRARPDVRAVVHCHTPSLIPFASSNVPLRAMYHMASFVADGVPVWDIRAAVGVSDMLVGDDRSARSLAQALGTRSAVLMRGHGAVVVANSLPNVVGRSVYLDLNAKAQVQALAMGGTVTGVAADEAHLRMDDPNEYARAWELWRRQLGQ